jgi:YD repeat-containing protein
MIRFRSFIAAAVFLTACSVLAQQHPNQEKGFDPSKLYHFADIDSINTFNGNLVVTLPLTQTYRVSPLLSYSFTPVYNANVWDARSYDPSLLELKTCQRCNAGLGWIVSLGRLIPPTDPSNSTNDANKGYVYESPDGRDHGFTPATQTSSYVFSTDESGLRMKVDESTKTIEFPDGTKRIFSDTTGIWRLLHITDPFGNHVDIDYSRSTSTHEIWDVAEFQDTTQIRSHTLEFNVSAAGSDANNTSAGTTFAQTYLTKITVAAFGNKTAEYVFNYTRATIPLPEADTVFQPSSPNNYTIHVFLLTSIDLITKDAAGNTLSSPLLGSYSMAMPGGYDMCAPSTSRCSSSGLLRTLRVPTGGTYSWEYTDIVYPHAFTFVQIPNFVPNPIVEHRQGTVGVSQRTLTDLDSHAATWYYNYVLNFPTQCFDISGNAWYHYHQTANAVTAPDGTVNVGYYSIYQSDACSDDQEFEPGDYGTPFTHWAKEQSTGLLLSTETYSGAPPSSAPSFSAPTASSPHLSYTGWTKRRTKRIRSGTLFVFGGSTFSPSAERTYYEDDCDTSCLSGQFSEIIRSNQDNAGHYRQISAGGTIGSGTGSTLYRTTFTNYPSAPALQTDPHTPWVFGIYTDQCSRVESTARAEDSVTSCGTTQLHGLSEGVTDKKDFNWKQFCFNSTTGFLERQRTIRLLSPGNGDLISVFSAASTGDVASEKYYGGETADGTQQTVPADGLCTASESTFGLLGYTINHTYLYGSLETSAYSGAHFNVDDRTIDKNTGLIEYDKDTTGLSTHYLYDLGGRITSLTPPGTLAASSFTYTSANLSGSAPTNATAKSTQTGTAGEGSRQSEYTFDGFGRVTRESSLMPDDTKRAHDTTYDDLGRKASETISATLDSAYPPLTKTTMSYDFAGRPLSITAPDLSSTTFAYRGIRRTDRTVNIATEDNVAAPSTTSEISDALGRLTEVDQPITGTATTVTKYAYDAADRLITVDMTADNSTQHREFEYDNRGFLLREQHPEIGPSGNGSVTYKGFDARGHARRKNTGSDSSPFDLVFEFDAFERLTAVKTASLNTLKTFTYGDSLDTPPPNSKGKITTAIRNNTIGAAPNTSTVEVDEDYAYDGPGGLLSSTKTTVTKDGVSSQFMQSETYNTLADVATVTYPPFSAAHAPDRTIENLNYNGFLIGVTGYAGGRDKTGKIIPAIGYWPSGMVSAVAHSDGTLDTYTPEHGLPRPAHIEFSNIQSCDAPPTPTISASTSTCANSANAASVPASPSQTYQWSISGGTLTSANDASSITYLAGASGTVHLSVTVHNECGQTAGSADVAIASSPTAPPIAAPATVCPNSTGNVASVLPNSTWSYAWTISGGSITSGGFTSTVTFLAGASGGVHLSMTATSSTCGTMPAVTRDVTISSAPSAPTITAPSSVQGGSTGNSASVPQDSSLTYAWSITGGAISSGGSTSAITFAAASSGTVHLVVTVTNLCGISSSSSKDVNITAGPRPDAPAWIEAHYAGPAPDGTTWLINVNWPAVTGATEYKLLRTTSRSNDEMGSWVTTQDHLKTTSVQDRVSAANFMYIYRVEATGPGGTSLPSPRDLAITVGFTDDPNHVIRAIDWTQMRTAAHAFCVGAQVSDMSQCTFTNADTDGLTMLRGRTISLVDLTELRTAVNAARSAFGLPLLQFADSSPAAHVTKVTLQQISEIRGALK